MIKVILALLYNRLRTCESYHKDFCIQKKKLFTNKGMIGYCLRKSFWFMGIIFNSHSLI